MEGTELDQNWIKENTEKNALDNADERRYS
jgi:hypothetical protein